MLYRTPKRQIFDAVILCFFLSSLTSAQTNSTNTQAFAKRSTAMATRPANTNRVSPDRGRRPDTFSPVVIYYRTAASITAAHGEAKPSDGKKSPLEPESFAKRPTTPATLAQPRALKPSPKVPTSFQPVTIHYPSQGTPASASVLRASDAEIAIERTPKNSLSELNAPKVGPASKVAAQPLRAFATNATISPTASLHRRAARVS